MAEHGFPLSAGELAQAAAILANGATERAVYEKQPADRQAEFWYRYDLLCAEERERERERVANPPSTREGAAR